jgi:3-oxoacyl-[acyl-carrier protein] reductase
MNVLITGATKGIGKSIAMNMAKNGHHLALCARNEADLDLLEKEIKSLYPKLKVYTKVANCAIKTDVHSFADAALEKFEKIDILVNSVGIFKPSLILDEDDDALEIHLKTNVFAAYYLYKKLAPSMIKQQNGYIFNICSVASIETIKNAGSYGVTKAALLSLNNTMREELMQYGIKVSAILPGSTLTNSWQGTDIPHKEFIKPEDVASAIDMILNLSSGANVDQILIKPIHGQL